MLLHFKNIVFLFNLQFRLLITSYDVTHFLFSTHLLIEPMN